MRFVIDANIIFAALLRDSKTREILLYPFFEFYTPEFALGELEKYSAEIMEKTGIVKEELAELLLMFTNKISVAPTAEYSHKIKEAKGLIGHIDKKDVPYLALALSIPNDGIWSNDEHFSKQTKIRHWRTKDILKERFAK